NSNRLTVEGTESRSENAASKCATPWLDTGPGVFFPTGRSPLEKERTIQDEKASSRVRRQSKFTKQANIRLPLPRFPNTNVSVKVSGIVRATSLVALIH